MSFSPLGMVTFVVFRVTLHSMHGEQDANLTTRAVLNLQLRLMDSDVDMSDICISQKLERGHLPGHTLVVSWQAAY